MEQPTNIAATLYPEPVAKPQDRAPNAEVQAVRDAEPARSFYRDDMQMGKAPQELVRALNPNVPADALEGQASVVASLMTDIGMNRDDVSQLASFAAQYSKQRPSADEQRAHERAASQQLRDTYGDKAFGDVLAGASALAQRDPRLSKFLNDTGLGSHPWVVSRLAELARSPRNLKR